MDLMATEQRKQYRGLRQYIVFILCVAAAIPLAVIGGGIYYEYRKSINEKVKAQLTAIVLQHKESIERFLSETSAAMRVVTDIESMQQISRQDDLKRVFNILQKEYSYAFEDMGVIDSKGNHIAYVGPYDLYGKNYSTAPWFKETMEKQIFISDVFLGFRQVPHFVIAVKKNEGISDWILRATVNAAKFGLLVEMVRLGRTGEAFIINKEGVYQTRSRVGGNVMDKAESDFVDIVPFEGVRLWEVDRKGMHVLRAKTWMKDNTWMLIVQQDVDDAFAELYSTRNKAIVVFVLGAFLVGAVAFFTTKLLVRKIEKADIEKNLLDEQLIQSQKLASIGELSAGIAHEINNPLAVIGEEAGWMQDLMKRETFKDMKELDDFKDSLREIASQTGRCREITHKLLSFARKMDSVLKDVEINRLIDEVVSMREREASFSNISFTKHYQDNLPLVYSDPSLLRQVMLNLINNAIDALPKGGEISIETWINPDKGAIHAGLSAQSEAVMIAVRDSGMGIPKENLTKIFDPFFTTKAPGKGTGLGLSICHGIIQKLGGNISVTSQVGKGTTFNIQIPIEQKKGAI
jgi:two-component system, NtrC family, sensor kinase